MSEKWIKCRFDDHVTDATSKGCKLPQKLFHAQGRFAIVDQGKDFVAGYTDQEFGVYEDIPAIIFGDHTRSLKYVDFPFFLGADGTKILKVDDIDVQYLYYYLDAHPVPNTGYNRHFSWLKKKVICAPNSPDEQRHIADVLSTCDEVIEKSERAAEKYRQIKAGMLNDLLTRGLDDRGRLRPPPFASPELYKDSELGPIPREWEVKRLGDVCSVQLGKMLDAAKNVGIEKPYIGNRSVQWGHFDLADIETVRLTEQDLGRFRLQKGDLIVCEGGEVGRCAIWNDELSECYYQKALHRVRLLAGVEYSIPFLAYCFQYFASLDMFTPLVTQTSIAHLPKEKLERLPIFYFSLAEQRAIAERLAAVDEWIAAEVKTAEKYRKVKAGLMEKLLTPPPDAEIEEVE